MNNREYILAINEAIKHLNDAQKSIDDIVFDELMTKLGDDEDIKTPEFLEVAGSFIKAAKACLIEQQLPKLVDEGIPGYYDIDGVSEFLTPAEAAERSGLAEITWRKRAAGGKIPGAFKKGKQWLIPRVMVSTKENRQWTE
jgi:hypothetical protein